LPAFVADVAALDADVLALLALVDAALAWYLAEYSPPATVPDVLVAQSLAKVAEAADEDAEAAAAAALDAAEEASTTSIPLGYICIT